MPSTIPRINGTNSRLEVRNDSGDYLPITGAQSFTISGGEPDTETLESLAGNVTITGQATGPSIEVPAYAAPLTPAVRFLRGKVGQDIQARLVVPGQGRVHSGGTAGRAAIATSGAVTFTAGNEPNLDGELVGVQDVLRIGNKNYIVDSFSGAKGARVMNVVDATTLAAPSAPVAAAAYTIWKPGVQYSFAASVVQAGTNISQDAGSAATTTYQLQLAAPLPNAEIHGVG